jgi:hypothetical protein
MMIDTINPMRPSLVVGRGGGDVELGNIVSPSSTTRASKSSSSSSSSSGASPSDTTTTKNDFANEDITHKIVQAVTQNSGLTYREMVLVVWKNLSSSKHKDACTVFRFDLRMAEDMFKLFDKNGDGEVSADEVEEVMQREDVKAYIMSLNNEHLKALVKVSATTTTSSAGRSTGAMKKKKHHGGEEEEVTTTTTKEFSSAISQSKSGCITKEDWLQFLAKLREDTMISYRKKAMIDGRVYLGLGLEPGMPYNATLTKYFGVQIYRYIITNNLKFKFIYVCCCCYTLRSAEVHILMFFYANK